jgi:hypothetical protein
MRKDQYLIKNAYRQPIVFTKITRGLKTSIPLPSDEWVEYDEKGNAAIRFSGVSFCDYKAVSEILQVFPALKGRSEGKFDSDAWALCLDFEPLV